VATIVISPLVLVIIAGLFILGAYYFHRKIRFYGKLLDAFEARLDQRLQIVHQDIAQKANETRESFLARLNSIQKEIASSFKDTTDSFNHLDNRLDLIMNNLLLDHLREMIEDLHRDGNLTSSEYQKMLEVYDGLKARSLQPGIQES